MKSSVYWYKRLEMCRARDIKKVLKCPDQHPPRSRPRHHRLLVQASLAVRWAQPHWYCRRLPGCAFAPWWDSYLTQAFIDAGFRGSKLKQLNMMHMALQVVTVADITTSDGRSLTHNNPRMLQHAITKNALTSYIIILFLLLTPACQSWFKIKNKCLLSYLLQ